MANLYSIAELIDKLIIENIKIFTSREKIHDKSVTDDEYVANENKMNILNENRGIIIKFLDEKIKNVIERKEENTHVRNVKTYYHSK
jgi:hypothetical protein